MKIGLFTCGYQHTSLEKAFTDAKAFDYDYIELWGGRPHAYAPDLLEQNSALLADIRSLIKAYGIPVPIYTPEHNAYPYNYMLGDEAQRLSSIRYLTGAMDAAKSLGASSMLISAGHGGDRPSGERWDRLYRTLAVLAREAEERDLILLLETLTPYESNTCTTRRELEMILSQVDSDALQGMCDVAAPFACGEDPADYFRIPGRKMRHLHFIDNDGVSDLHLIPGEGVMPMEKLWEEIRKTGYDGTVTLELVTHYMDRPSEAAREAIRQFRRLLGAAEGG